MGRTAEYRFRCPECRHSFAVNAPMREALVNGGCVLCGATVPRSAFFSW